MRFAKALFIFLAFTVASLAQYGIDAADPWVSPHHGQGETTTSAMELKFKAFDLASSMKSDGCRKAMPMLKEVLRLYRAGRSDYGKHRVVREGGLIDEINILTVTALCNLVLDENRGFARAIADQIMVREEVSRIPYLARFANPAGGAFQQVASLVDSWRSQFKTDNKKKEMTERIRRELDEAVRFLVREGNESEALVLSENMRGRAFGDLLASKTKLIAPPRAESVDTVNIPSPIATEYLPLRDLLSIVEESSSTTIVYHMLDDRLFIWVISPRPDQERRIILIEVPGGERVIGPLVQCLNELFQQPIRQGEDVSVEVNQQKELQLLSALHSLLIAPIPQELLPDNPMEPLTIVPHGVLFNVPFSALVYPLATSPGDILANHHAVAITPSIAIFRHIDRSIEVPVDRRNQTLLALVNPKPRPEVAVGLHALEDTQREFPALAELFPDPARNMVLYGNEALPGVLSGYDLRLMSVKTTDELEGEGRFLVIVALVGDVDGKSLHIRIFDASGEKVVDKAEKQLESGETLTALKQQLTALKSQEEEQEIIDGSSLSLEDKQEIIRKATSSAGHTLLSSEASRCRVLAKLVRSPFKTYYGGHCRRIWLYSRLVRPVAAASVETALMDWDGLSSSLERAAFLFHSGK